MTVREARSRQHLTDLFAGPFPGHGIIAMPPTISPGELGDFAISDQPIKKWVPWATRNYLMKVGHAEAVADDAVPYVNLTTTTGVFAGAFGCPIHVYDADTPAAAMPIVSTAQEADQVLEPTLDAPTIRRVFELARLARRELGPEVPISVPDIQSPFDIAAQIWRKEDMFMALVEEPDAVRRLVGKCHRLLNRFLIEFQREFSQCNLCHCPYAWAPPKLGCWLSEDEVGSLSPTMFDEFCLPSLTELSNTFGGMFMHCCAKADHQYSGFCRIPNLRGINRIFQAPGPGPAIKAFSGKTVLMMAWLSVEECEHLLDLAQGDTRFLFNPTAKNFDDARRVVERLRGRCGR